MARRRGWLSPGLGAGGEVAAPGACDGRRRKYLVSKGLGRWREKRVGVARMGSLARGRARGGSSMLDGGWWARRRRRRRLVGVSRGERATRTSSSRGRRAAGSANPKVSGGGLGEASLLKRGAPRVDSEKRDPSARLRHGRDDPPSPRLRRADLEPETDAWPGVTPSRASDGWLRRRGPWGRRFPRG
jgi:hypothetical protein